MRRGIRARTVRDGIEAPQFLAVLTVVGRDVATHAHLRTAVADDDAAVDDARCAADSIGLGLVHGQRRPEQLAAVAVERDESSIERAEEQAVAPRCKAAVDDIAAGPDARFARHLRIVLPAQLARDCVVRLHFGPGGRDVDRAVNHQRRGFLSARRIQVREPRESQVLHVAGVDLFERREALLIVGTAMRQPLTEIARRGGQCLAIHRGRGRRCGRHGCA